MLVWEEKTLDELCHFTNGLWKGKKPPFTRVGVIRNTNFQKDGFLDYNNIAYLDVEENAFSKRRLQYGDIILEKSGGGPRQPVGRVALYDKKNGDFTFSNFTACIRVRQPSLLDFRYLHTFLFWKHISGITEQMQSHSTGIRNLNNKAYRAINIAYPPLPEQQRIAAVLGETFKGIERAKANAEKNLQNARELFEEYLQSVFAKCGEDWCESTIGECVHFIDYRGKTPKKTENALRLITAKNVKMGFLQDSPREYVSPEIYDKWMVRGIPERGDVLFTTEAPLANIAQLDTDEKVVFAQRIIIMRPDNIFIDKTFLKYLLMSPVIQARIQSKGTGATVKGIKAKLLKNVEIKYPKSLKMQEQIVKEIDYMNEQKNSLLANYTNRLKVLDELKKSLLDQAFTGNL